MSARRSIADLSVDLADRAESFCRWYFPEGRKQGNYWQVGDTSGAKGQSLAIRLQAQGGRKAGSWTDYATGEYGDLIDLLIFVVIGQADHNTLNQSNPILGALPNLVALAIPWFIVAFLLRAFPRKTMRLPQFLGRSALAWLIAAPLGLLLRAILQHRGGIPIPFLIVTLLVGGLMLLGWRLVFWLVAMRKEPVQAETGSV